VIRAVIFDLFGTLVANYGREHYLEVVENMGRAVDASPEAFRDLWRKHYVDRLTGVHTTESDNIRWVCDQLEICPDDAQVARSNEIYLEFARPFLMSARESAENVLHELQNAGIKTGLISDCGPWVPNNWASSPFAGLIDFPVYSSRSGMKKPAMSLYEEAAAGLSAQPEECLYVADGNGEELPAAKAFGMEAVKITPWNSLGATPDAEFKAWDGTTIDSLTGLLSIVS